MRKIAEISRTSRPCYWAALVGLTTKKRGVCESAPVKLVPRQEGVGRSEGEGRNRRVRNESVAWGGAGHEAD